MVKSVLTEQVTEQTNLAFVKFWHALAGIYIWEFFTALGYEWRVIRGHLPYRWTIWLYSLTRTACLVGVIFTFVIMDSSTPVNCQFWIYLISTLFCLSFGAASLLIVLRIIAIWNRNKAVMVTTIGLWGIGVAFHIRYITRLRSQWDPVQYSCSSVSTTKGVIGLVPTIFADLALLPILLVGLVLMRRHDGCTLGLSSLVWRQGVIWLLIVFLSETPAAVVAVLRSNDQFINILLSPGLITMTIAATRMHRSLVDFASGSSDVALENLNRASAVVFSGSRLTQAASILPPNRIEVTVHRAFEQNMTAQVSGNGSCNSTDEQMHEKSSEKQSAWGLGEDVIERVM